MKFYIIGIDDSHERSFTEEVKVLVQNHQVFSGGLRHYELVRERLPKNHRWIPITVPLDTVFDHYQAYEEIVVFASGDPLFFGFANTIKNRLPEADIRIYPWFNSLQLLAHRLILPYQDMQVVSLTGRPWPALDCALIEQRSKIGVLTDRVHTPSAIAWRLLSYGYDNYRMHVGELLGNENERVQTLELTEACRCDFAFPNCLILEQTTVKHRYFGIPEEEFHLLDGRTRMITKMPVRLVTLSMLDLYQRRFLWDIGFCTGSVSIEARLQFPHLEITAFEQRAEGRILMERNSRKFGAPGITAVTGDFMSLDLSSYASPDAVFIGGYGGRLEEMIYRVNEYLRPEGVVVFNSVSEESQACFVQTAKAAGWQVRESRRIAVGEYNPIVVIKAVKSSSLFLQS